MATDRRDPNASTSGAKYSTGSLGARTRWAAKHGVPVLTEHAIDRWDRAPADAVSPEHALLHARRDERIVGHPAFVHAGTGRECSAIYVYGDTTEHGGAYGMVFLVVDNGDETMDGEVVSTCYPIAGIHQAPLRAYLWTLAARNGLGRGRSADAAEVES